MRRFLVEKARNLIGTPSPSTCSKTSPFCLVSPRHHTRPHLSNPTSPSSSSPAYSSSVPQSDSCSSITSPLRFLTAALHPFPFSFFSNSVMASNYSTTTVTLETINPKVVFLLIWCIGMCFLIMHVGCCYSLFLHRCCKQSCLHFFSNSESGFCLFLSNAFKDLIFNLYVISLPLL